MASVSTQAEWMTHFAGKTIPNAEKLACLETPRGPVMFFIDKIQSQLQVLKPSPKGEHHLLNLSTLWKLKGVITSISASNDANSLYLAFSKAKADDENEDSVFATISLSYTLMDDVTVWEKALIKRAPETENILGASATVRAVVIGNVNTWGSQRLPSGLETYKVSYPDIVVHYEAEEVKPREKKFIASDFDYPNTGKVTQLARVVVNPDGKTFRYEFIIMTNVDDGSKMVFVPGICGITRGVFAAYEHRGSPSLNFINFPPGVGYYALNNNWEVVKGNDKVRDAQMPNALQTLVNSDGSTDLVASYEAGVRWHGQKDPIDQVGRDICQGPCSGCRVAKMPEGNMAAVWMVKNKQLGYMKLDTKKSTTQEWTPIAKGEFSNFSPCINGSDTLARIMYIDSNDTIIHLEQTSTGMWNPQPFSIPDPKEIREMTCYVCHVKLTTDKLKDSANVKVMLSSTSTTTVSVNGQLLVVDSAGKPVTTDESGKLEIINLTESLGTPSFSISNVANTTVLAISPVVLDPAKNVRRSLASKSSPDDLKNAKNANGDKIFPSDTDFTQLSNTLKDITKEMGVLPSNGSSRPVTSAPTEGASSDWAVVHWLKTKWGQVKRFFIRAGYFFLEVAGKVYNFFVGCYEQALSALQYVFGMVKAKLEDVRDYLGFIFNWGDIVKTQQSMVAMFKFAGTLGDSVIDKGFDMLDDCLGQVITYVSGSTDKRKADIASAGSATNTRNTRSSMDGAADRATLDNEKENPKTSHTSIDYINGKLSWISSGAALDVPAIKDDTVNSDFFLTQLNGLLSNIENNLKTLREQIALTFAKGSELTIGTILEKLGTAVVVSLITAFRNIIKAIKSTFKAVYRAFFTLALAEVDIPFFSSLYKKATGSKTNPSLVSVVTLIAAIPITVILKIATGKSMPEFTEETFTNLLGKDETGPNRTPRDVNENAYWPLYQSCMPVLRLWAQAQPTVIGIVNFYKAYMVYQQFQANFLPGGDPILTLRYMTISVMKVLTHMGGVPVVEPDEWDQTVMPTERFLLWGLELGVLGFLDIYAGWYAAKIPAISPFISSFQTLANVLLFFFTESIALNEVLFEFKGNSTTPAWSPAKTTKRKKVGGWWMAEILCALVAGLAPPGVELAEKVDPDPESRILIRAVGSAVLLAAGLATPVSLMGRGFYLGVVSDTMGILA